MLQEKEVILITGSSGRIGTSVASRFSDDKYQLVGLDIVKPKKPLKNLDYIYADLSSDVCMNKVMDEIRKKYGSRIASVIHLAAYYNFKGGQWDLYEKITLGGTKRLVSCVQNFETEQFIFSSSMFVHAPCSLTQKINETWPEFDSWEYPRSKIEVEKFLQKNHGKIPLVIFQIAKCYDDTCHSVMLGHQIQRIWEHQFECHLFPGDIAHGSSFLHIDDLSDALFLAVQSRKRLPDVMTMLIGEEEVLSYDELQRMIGLLIDGKEVKTYQVPKWIAKVGAWVQNHTPGVKPTFIKPWMVDLAGNNYSLDISLIKRTLGWEPKHSLRKTLPNMIKGLKTNPIQWYHENQLPVPAYFCKKKGC